MVGMESVQETGSENQSRDWQKLVCQYFANNEAIVGRCSFGFDEKGHRVQLEIEAVKRVEWEEQRGTALAEGDEGFSVEEAEREERVGRTWETKRKRSTEAVLARW